MNLYLSTAADAVRNFDELNENELKQNLVCLTTSEGLLAYNSCLLNQGIIQSVFALILIQVTGSQSIAKKNTLLLSKTFPGIP